MQGIFVKGKGESGCVAFESEILLLRRYELVFRRYRSEVSVTVRWAVDATNEYVHIERLLVSRIKILH
jgi:hypothetical protein